MKKISIFFVLVMMAASLVALPVYAQDYSSCDKEKELADILKCRAGIAKAANDDRGFPSDGGNYIDDRYFDQPGFLDPSNFSLFSYIAVIVNIVILGILLYWVFLVIKAAYMIISSMGKPEGLQKGVAQIGATFRSIAALFVFILILIIAGNFFGIGSIWEWPNSFRQCEDGKFLFTKKLEESDGNFEC